MNNTTFISSTTLGSRQGVGTEANTLLKREIWLYFFLLIFEGALRKWLLPQLATPLLLIREPLAILIIIQSLNRRYFQKNIYLLIVVIVTSVSFFATLIFGHGNLAVAVFGARIFLVQLPIIFSIGKIFSNNDVIAMGRWALYLSLPMIVLVIIQFYSPQSAWVNRGIGGDTDGGGFTGALGFFRPPATFSFTTGTVQFFSVVAVFVFYFWLNQHLIKKYILITATIALLLSIPFSISRSLLFSVILLSMFYCVAIRRRPGVIANLLTIAVVLVLITVIRSKYSFIQTAIEAFTDRFTSANEQEGGLSGVLVDRYLGGMIGALSGNNELPFWGLGLGMGTNVGAQLLSGNLTFLISEGEWGRLIGEMGLLSGLTIILIRVSLSVRIAVEAYKKTKLNDFLGWMLAGLVLIMLPQGQWAQPTTLGFTVLVSGLCLAALNDTTPEQK